MSARHIPFEEEFDVIGAFDVLEHIQEDELVLSSMNQAVCKGGGVILTVPQHPVLWSRHDEISCHVRRYTLAELKTKVEGAGFVATKTLSFVSLLLPLLIIARFQKRRPIGDIDPCEELRIRGVTNLLLEKALAFVRVLIQLGVSSRPAVHCYWLPKNPADTTNITFNGGLQAWRISEQVPVAPSRDEAELGDDVGKIGQGDHYRSPEPRSDSDAPRL